MKYQHSEKDDTIIEFIVSAINDHLDEWYGDPSGLKVMAPDIITYTNCFILRFPLSRPNMEIKNILVKIRRRPNMTSLNQAILKTEIHAKIPAEYHDLLSLYQFFKNCNDPLGAIRPLIYLENHFAVVMEEFKSQNLQELFMDWKTILGFKKNIHDLLHAAQLTGQLLNVFHTQVHQCHEIENPFQPIMQEVLALFEHLQNASWQKVLVNPARSKFVQKINTLRSRKVIYSNTHGDMTSNNVLYSKENKVCLIDIKTKHAPIFSDIGLILIHPDTFMPQIFSFGHFFPRKTIQAYRAAILTGYFGDQMIDADLLNLYCAIKMLDKWVMYEAIMSRSNGLKKIRARLAAPLLRAYFQTGVIKYLDAIKVP